MSVLRTILFLLYKEDGGTVPMLEILLVDHLHCSLYALLLIHLLGVPESTLYLRIKCSFHVPTGGTIGAGVFPGAATQLWQAELYSHPLETQASAGCSKSHCTSCI